ncbi:TolB family protein [Flavihumibacter solisilvae]|uniref:Uncharacterized protein n=1 Tax=Flavihumibacter solisilvae TaxID=1349421 RepID=A0A0C1IQG5_9BACT|nr:hypothetical protein [Flavihumibacter solisilvae]KIC92719.1 hypothetical protein OI18_21215 [Flavihumibacter solisilvae]
MRKTLVAILFLVTFLSVRAQQFGGHPPSQRWMQIRTPSVRVIYPQGWDSSSRRIATVVNLVTSLHDSSIGSRLMRTNIILQHQTTIPNGYVALAPFRSEFYMTPPSNPFELGSLAWGDQLALHEWRHVQQYSNFNRGLAKVFRVLLGQQGQAFANALTVPDWFFEGDAVFQETRMSRQGRGRLPSFFNGYRSIWEAGTNYSYMKLRNGSYRHFVPDHYEMGYQLVANGNEQYGPGFWKKVSENAAAMKGFFYPFQKAVKRYSGISFARFVDSSLLANRTRLGVPSSALRKGGPEVINEENPVYTESGDLLLVRSSYKQVPSFYLRTGQKDHFIRTRDMSLDNYFAYANGKIVYASFRRDTRWSWIDYSELQLLDLHSGKQQRITEKSKYFMPSLSAGGDSIVTVEASSAGKYALHILDVSGGLVKAIPNKQSHYYSHPMFYQGKIITAARNSAGDMSLLLVDPANGNEHPLTEWSQNLVGYPSGKGDTICFTMTSNGRDRNFALVFSSRQLLEWKEERDVSVTGEYQPSVFGSRLVSSRFTAGGYKISEQTAGVSQWQPVESIRPLTAFGLLAGDKPLVDVLAKDTVLNPGTSNYRKTTKFFNFHSWLPYYEDPELSFTIFGQNLLNTMQSELYILYNNNEGFKEIGFAGVYGGWFPYINAGLSYTLDRRARLENKQVYWNELEAQTGFQVPLNLSKGRSISNLTFGSDLVYNHAFFPEPQKTQYGIEPYFYLDNDLRFSHQVQQAKQHIFPRWAQTMRLQYRDALNQFDSWQLMATGSLYFPGLSVNHSFSMNLAAQQRDSSTGIRFTNDFPFARGYSDENLFRMGKIGVNYQLPIAYPDAGLWNIVYLMRMRMNFFYDHAVAKDSQRFATDGFVNFRSTGTELFFDTKWWNQLPVSFGIRYSRLLDDDVFGGTGRDRIDFVIPVNLIQARGAGNK